ncbi:hypothetical protein ACGFI9_35555 [Micromonospora sp. NPDC048930]|uniref:hypothetical protein n=1 Tax=Micromonospora sp. NPDC048930 TaxID=3364261 RepID=UPI00372452BD
MEQLLADAPALLTLTPQTTDMRRVSDWLLHWTVAAGIEGVVTKRSSGRYEPGRRGWSKFRTRIVTEAIVGGVTGGISNPDTALLGRFDWRGQMSVNTQRSGVNVSVHNPGCQYLTLPRHRELTRTTSGVDMG